MKLQMKKNKAGFWRDAGPLTFVLLFCLGLALAAVAHESPVDHVERELRLWVEDGRLHLSYRIQQSERAVLLQLHRIDTSGDGVVSEAEREAFFTAQARRIAGLFALEVDGQALKLAPAGGVQLDARLGQTFTFSAPLASLRPGRHAGRLADGYSRMYPGPFRWRGGSEGKGARVELRAEPGTTGAALHPAWLALKFDVVVPD